MYNKVQVDSRVPQLEKDIEESRLKWVDLVKERAALATEVRQVPKLEPEVKELKTITTNFCNHHQAEV